MSAAGDTSTRIDANTVASHRAAPGAWDAAAVDAQLSQNGYALLPGLFGSAAAPWQAAHESNDLPNGPLPPAFAVWRHALYRRLAPIANRWAQALGEPVHFPPELTDFDTLNRATGQNTPLSQVTRLNAGAEVALRQDTADTLVFPLQVVGLLSAPDADFTGGAFVLVEQRPRMQSRPSVVPLQFGDAAIICTGPRPVRGRQGIYRVNVRHAIARVRSGQRVGLSLSFHGAL